MTTRMSSKLDHGRTRALAALLALAALAIPAIALADATDPPTCDSVSDQTYSHSAVYSFALNCSVQDGQGGGLTYSVSGETVGTITGTDLSNLEYNASGTLGTDDLTITVSDERGGETQVSFRATVKNDPPDCFLTGPISVIHGASHSASTTYACSDPEGFDVFYAIVPSSTVGTAAIDASGTATYTADGTTGGGHDFVGETSFDVIAGDAYGDGPTATVGVTVTNEQPTCTTDPAGQAFSVRHDKTHALSIDCTDGDGDAITYFSDDTGTKGYTYGDGISPSGFVYTANGTDAQGRSYVGATSTKLVADDGAETTTKTFAITVTNDAPVCTDVSLPDVHMGAQTSATVVGNGTCTDADDDLLTIDPPGTAAKGVAGVSGASLTYTANNPAIGGDGFSYTVADPYVSSVAKTASVTITNSAPECSAPSSVQVHAAQNAAHQTPIGISLPCSDADGDPLSVTITDPPDHGSVDYSSGQFAYTPAVGNTADDSFAYTVTDGQATSSTLTQAIDVTNLAPTCQTISQTIRRGSPATFEVFCSDLDNDDFTVTGGTPSAGTIGAFTPVAGSPGLYHVTYTPPASDAIRSATFSYTASDTLESSASTATVTITRNHQPSCVTFGTVIIGQGAGATPLSFYCGDPDYQDQVLTPSVQTGPTTGSLGTPAVSGGPSFYSVAYVTGPGAYADHVRVRMTDGAGAFADVSLDAHVSDKALCEPLPAIQLRPGASRRVTLDCTPPPGHGITSYQINHQPGHGVTASLPQLSPGSVDLDAFGATPGGDSDFTYSVQVNLDPSGALTSPTVAQPITVGSSANDAPVCSTNDGFILSEAVAYNDRDNRYLPFCTDAENDVLTPQPLSTPAHGTVTVSDGRLVYHPNAGYVGDDSFTYKVTDALGATSNTVSLELDVQTAVAPSCSGISPASLALRPGQTKAFTAICSYPQFDNRTFSVVSGPSLPGAEVGGGGLENPTFSYSAPGTAGTDAVSVHAANVVGTSNTVSLPVDVSSTANEAPVCTPGTLTATKDATPQALDIASRCSDFDGDALTYSVTPGSGLPGSIAGGSGVTYTGDGGSTGFYSFTVTATDSRMTASTPQIITLQVIASNKPLCTLASPTLQLRTGRSKSSSLSCTSPNGSPISYAVVQPPSPKGTVNRTGSSALYTSTADGADSFTWQATNSAGTTTVTQNTTASATYNEPPSCFTNGSAFPEEVSTVGTSTLDLGSVCLDPEDDPLVFTTTSDPAPIGTVTDGPASAIVFTPSGTAGTGSFGFTATDQPPAGATPGTTGTTTYHVKAVAPQVPTCVDVDVSVRPSKARSLSLSCTSPSGTGTPTFKITQSPASGTLTPAGDDAGQFITESTYASLRSFTAPAVSGDVTFKYKATNSVGDSLEHTVTVHVDANYNTAPTCFSDLASQTVPAQQTSPLTGTCSDDENDPLTYQVQTQTGQHGAAAPTGTPGALTFAATTPGPDTVTVKAYDGRVYSNTFTISVSVIQPAVPTCPSPSAFTVRPGGSRLLDLTCSDGTQNALVYAISPGPSKGTLDPPVSNTAAPIRTYTAGAASSGADSFSYTASNATGSSVTRTQAITIDPAFNSAPACFDVGANAKPGQTRLVDPSCFDSESDSFAPEIVAGLSPAGAGTLTLVNGRFRFAASPSFTSGTATFTYRVTDAPPAPATAMTSTIKTVTLTATTANTAPSCIQFGGQSVQTGQTAIVPTGGLCSDPDADTLTYHAQATRGQVTGPDANDAFTYTAPSTAGPDSVEYWVNDGLTDSVHRTVAITVTAPANVAPTCASGSVSTKHDTALAIPLDCSDANGDALTYAIDTPPAAGCGSLGTVANGSVTFTPAAAVTCSTSFTFHASDAQASSATATLAVTVTNGTPACDAVTSVTAVPEVGKSIAVSCADADGDAVTVTKLTDPAKGTLTLNGSTFTYTGNAGASGSDAFTFTAKDALNAAAPTRTVTINLDRKPVCDPIAKSTKNHTPIAVTLTCSDPDGTALTFTATNPSNGALSAVTGSSVTFTPTGDFDGAGGFSFSASDATSTVSSTATVTVAANQAPACVGAQGLTTKHDTAADVTFTCTDDEGDTVTRAVQSAATHGTATTSTYTPTAHYAGPDAFTLRATDGHGGSTDRIYTVDVTNARPTCSAVSAATKNHTPKSVTLSCADADGDGLTYSASSAAHGTLSAVSGSSVTFTPDGDYAGDATFSFTAGDGVDGATGTAQAATATVAVAANQAPACSTDATITTKHDTAKPLSFTCTDDEGDTLTRSVGVDPQHGAATVSSYTPAAHYAGDDAFTLRAVDGHGGQTDTPVTVGVTNARPVCTAVSASTKNHTPKSVTLTCTDDDQDPLSYAASAAVGVAISSVGGNSLTVTPDGDSSGGGTFSFTASDGVDGASGTSAPQTATITVAANAKPACPAVSADVAHDTAKTVTLSCTDDEGDAVALTKASGPAHGTATVSGTSLSYTPAAGYAGPDEVSASGDDGHGGVTTFTVSLTVAAAQPVTTPTPTPTVAPTTTAVPTRTPTPTPSVIVLKGTAKPRGRQKPKLTLTCRVTAGKGTVCTLASSPARGKRYTGTMKVGGVTLTGKAKKAGKGKLTLTGPVIAPGPFTITLKSTKYPKLTSVGALATALG